MEDRIAWGDVYIGYCQTDTRWLMLSVGQLFSRESSTEGLVSQGECDTVWLVIFVGY